MLDIIVWLANISALIQWRMVDVYVCTLRKLSMYFYKRKTYISVCRKKWFDIKILNLNWSSKITGK